MVPQAQGYGAPGGYISHPLLQQQQVLSAFSTNHMLLLSSISHFPHFPRTMQARHLLTNPELRQPGRYLQQKKKKPGRRYTDVSVERTLSQIRITYPAWVGIYISEL